MHYFSEDYIDQIRQMGYRMTPQRQIVLDAVSDLGGHATAVEVCEHVQERNPFVNRATVYRALDFWCEVKAITRTDINGRAFFEVAGEEPHHHLVCRGCGHVDVLAGYHFEPLVHHLSDEHGFKAEITHFAITGLCSDCQKEEDEQS